MHILRGAVQWIDIVKPSKEDVDFVRAEHDFHPVILEELLTPSSRARVERYHDYLYLVYHMPVYDERLKTSRQAEIDFLITKDKVITVRYEELEPMGALIGKLNGNPQFAEQIMSGTSLALVYHILQSLLGFSLRQLRHIEEKIRDASLKIFEGSEKNLLQNISYTKRDLLDYRLVSKPQEILFASLTGVGSSFWEADAKIYLDDLAGENLKIQQYLENYLQTISSLEQTNAQLLTIKINRTIQTFTMLAFFTFPLVLFSTVYSIDNRTPVFWLGFAAIAVATACLPFILKNRDKKK